jgi:hypothetical protein
MFDRIGLVVLCKAAARLQPRPRRSEVDLRKRLCAFLTTLLKLSKTSSSAARTVCMLT